MTPDSYETMSISAYHTQEQHCDDSRSSVPLHHHHLLPTLTRSSVYTHSEFIPDLENYYILVESTRILVVGAGGLGCEVLKNLAYSGFTDIHIIDMDTIDISNLNRQFLFTEHDIGKYKSVVAADVISNKTGISIQSHTCAIQDKPKQFYQQFNLIIAGLDNIAARQWLNDTIVDLVQYNNDDEHTVNIDSIVPLIDGGTEAFNGQARVFIPYHTSCFECSLQSLTPQNSYPMCTIRNVPRLPEHCIQYALKIEWPLLIEFNNASDYKMIQRNIQSNDVSESDGVADDVEVESGNIVLDTDNMEHMSWLYNRALSRATQYNITGVTYSLTMQVIKNIIPAIASTNALISAACVNEVYKYRTQCSRQLNNYYMYIGASAAQGIHTETMEYQRNPECTVCHTPLFIRCDGNTTLDEFIQLLHTQAQYNVRSLSYNGNTLYMANLPSLYESNLSQSLSDLSIQSNTRMIGIDHTDRTQKIIVQYNQ